MKTVFLFLLFYGSSAFFSLVFAKKPGDYADCLTPKGNYQFSDFKEGKVYFKDGKSTNAKLNYNYLHGAIEFINGTRDTLLMTNKSRINYIKVDETIFYSQEEKGEMEVVADFGTILLAKKTHFVLKGNKANASEQKYVAAPENSTPTSLLISNQSGEFRWQNNTVRPEYTCKTEYYVIDRNRIFHIAKRSSLMKIYGRNKSELSGYLKKNDIHFNNENELKQLLAFCSSM